MEDGRWWGAVMMDERAAGVSGRRGGWWLMNLMCTSARRLEPRTSMCVGYDRTQSHVLTSLGGRRVSAGGMGTDVGRTGFQNPMGMSSCVVRSWELLAGLES